MGVELDLSKATHRRIFVDFGPYSIHVETIDEVDAEPLLVLHDCGDSVTVCCHGPEEAVDVRSLLTKYQATYNA